MFYFSRRHARLDAEDLAQETLLAVWSRDDYEFASEEDFLKVCYGFARRKLLEGYRESRRHEGSVADDSLSAPQHAWGSQRATESRLLLEQVLEIGQAQLGSAEWQMIEQSADLDDESGRQEPSPKGANKMRVRLHRARKKLAKLAGLGKRYGVTAHENEP